MHFHSLTSTFTPTIFTWSFYSDFPKIERNTFKIKVQLNILNALLWEQDIENKFLEILTSYPETREVLPILLAVRGTFTLVLDSDSKELKNMSHLFKKDTKLSEQDREELLKFFHDSGLRNIFENKKITNLSDYVFGIETGLDTNARKNRSGTQMEDIVEDFIKNFCEQKKYQYKAQATAKWILENWKIEVKSDKSERRFDFAIFDEKEVFLIETNFYGGGGSKLKAVAGEFTWLYHYLWEQGIKMFWITDGLGWQTTLRPLEDAYNKTDGNIYNLQMLKEGILETLIK